MKIGIIGSDDRAVAIGRLFRTGGHRVTFGDPAKTERAKRAAESLGTQSETPYRQAMASDLLLIAVERGEIDRAVSAVGSRADAIVVDAVDQERGTASRSGAEMLAHKLDDRRLVRALINLPQPGSNIPICGDDPSAKNAVDRALRSCGCLTTDRGPLSNARKLEAPA